MTEDQIISLGLFCEQLMSNEQFAELVQQFDLQCYAHMMSTADHETKKREGIFARRSGLHDFLGHMKAVVQQKDDIMKRMEPSLQEDAPLDEFID